MQDLAKNFGIVIAFLLPGFSFLWGISLSYDDVASWMASSSEHSGPTVGGFLYVTLASLAVGLFISAVRWLVVDHLLQWLGVKDPGIDYGRLSDKDRYAAFSGVVENHYRYYQYYANTLMATLGAFAARVFFSGRSTSAGVWLAVAGVCAALFLGSRDALNKYYLRAHKILSNPVEQSK